MNIIKERVSFAKRLESGRTLNRIEGKGRAFGQNSPFFFLLPSCKTGKVRLGAGGGPRRRPGPRGRPELEGKGRGARGGSIPPLIREEAARGGVATVVGGGQRSPFVVAALWGAAAAGDRGEMERRVRGFHPRAHLGLGRLGEAGPLGPAAASG